MPQHTLLGHGRQAGRQLKHTYVYTSYYRTAVAYVTYVPFYVLPHYSTTQHARHGALVLVPEVPDARMPGLKI